jgi:hypothetical protein
MAFPFSIEDEAKLLPLKNAKITGGTIYADCPFCGSKGALHISLTKNVWNCCSCMMKGANDSGGGRTELYAKFYNMSNSKAYHIICDLYGIQRDYRSEEEDEPVAEQPKKDVREIDYAYRTLLSLLTLTDEHRKNLRKRGLDDAAIQKHQYRSVPVTGIDNIVNTMLSYDIDLNGIPGFYMLDGKWKVNFTPALAGILIPVISREGYIQGMQIRLNKPIRTSKYLWFSSQGKECGSSPGSPVHFIGDPTSKTVMITEGSLKANVAYEMSKHLMKKPMTFVAIAGCGQFNSMRKALLSLKDFGCDKIYDGFDMDKMKNPNVYRAMAKNFDIAKEIGVRMQVYRWNAIEIFGNFKQNVPYKVLINDSDYAFYSTYRNHQREFYDEFYADEKTGRLIIPEPILDPQHPHEDVNCKLIDTETGDYTEFKMNVDASVNQCSNYTVWQRKGIDDYFYSLVRLKNMQRKN